MAMIFSMLLSLLMSPRTLLVVAAAVPAVVLLVRVYRQDKVEQEPPRLIGALLGLGAVAAIVAMLVEAAGSWLLVRIIRTDGWLFDVIYYFVVIGLVEEASKYVMLKRGTWGNPDFNYTFDAVVYAVSVSLGFAVLENIMYVFQNGLGVALIRAITAIPGHACFGVFMGCWYGQAYAWHRAANEQRSARYRAYALAVPTLLHGAYDFLATLTSYYDSAWLLFIAYIALMFFATIRLTKRLSNTDMPL